VATQPQLSPGTRVGRYEVRRLRGTVYVAHDHALDREIALEVVDERRAELRGGAKISPRPGLGDPAKAIADFEAALQVFEHSDVDVRYAATVRALGKELWSSDRARAVQLVRAAVVTLKPAPTKFGDVLAESETWLAEH
jgi:hypothetical protein